MQARGDNLFSLLKAFSNASQLQITYGRKSFGDTYSEKEDERAVFFDYLTWFIVSYNNCGLLSAHSLCI